jgi:hypothetical protein
MLEDRREEETALERFDGLLSRIFEAGKKKAKPEEDAEEIVEGGVPPSEGVADE